MRWSWWGSLWNYNPDNDDISGDNWNGENFSWFGDKRARLRPTVNPSYTQSDSSLDIGGRILHSIVKPYPTKVAGILLSTSYEVQTGEFSISWAFKKRKSGNFFSSTSLIDIPPLDNLDNLACRETEIYVPNLITRGRKLIVQGVDERRWRFDESRQTLFVLNPSGDGGAAERVAIRVLLDPSLQVTSWSKGNGTVPYYFMAFVTLLLAVVYVLFGRG